MAAKPDAKDAAPAGPPANLEKGGAAKEKEGAPPAAPASSGSSALAWLVAVGAVVLAPVLSWALANYLLLPQLEKRLSGPVSAASAPSAAESAPAPDAKSRPAPPTYEFSNVVVNLAGTMGTRYLKTSFVVTGSDSALASIFEGDKARLTDVTLNVLSSLTLADLEEPGSKNVLREKLVAAYNQTLGRKVADQVYFSDFVVQ
jgi:flagellar FliL protein